jgi:hypothetical protein
MHVNAITIAPDRYDYDTSTGADPTKENNNGFKPSAYCRAPIIKELLIQGEQKVISHALLI